MRRFTHVDGEIVPTEEASVSVRDRGFLYGDAIFETMRVYGGVPFEWSRHMERLEASAEHLEIEYELERDDLRDRVDELLEANGLIEAYVRLSITRGVQPGRLTPAPTTDPTVVILVEPLSRGGESGERVWDEPATCTISSTQRISNDAIPAAAKTHNYLNGILARLTAREAGVDEAILLDADGHLTEGATSNLFFVTDGELRTPTTLDLPVLPGITRAVVIELASDLGLPVHEGAWSVEHLLAADEAFLTNSTWEIRPLVQIDDHALEIGTRTVRLSAAFDRRIQEECYDARRR